jgi:hypothetical protein
MLKLSYTHTSKKALINKSFGRILGILTMVDLVYGGFGIRVIAQTKAAYNTFADDRNIDRADLHGCHYGCISPQDPPFLIAAHRTGTDFIRVRLLTQSVRFQEAFSKGDRGAKVILLSRE